MTHAIPDSLIERIRKILALSNSNVEGEREAALLKAQELATRHNIDLAQIEPARVEREEPIQKEEMACGKRLPVTQHLVSRLLQTHFGVRVIYSGGRYYGRTLTLVGTKTDVEFARFVNGFLNTEFMVRWHEYKERNCAPVGERNSFLFGASRGLDEKLTLAKRKAELDGFASVAPEKRDDTQKAYALMVVSKESRVDAAVDEMFPTLRSVRRSYSGHHSANAYSSGFAAGRRINIARPISNG
jgi:hypothetical protein